MPAESSSSQLRLSSWLCDRFLAAHRPIDLDPPDQIRPRRSGRHHHAGSAATPGQAQSTCRAARGRPARRNCRNPRRILTASGVEGRSARSTATRPVAPDARYRVGPDDSGPRTQDRTGIDDQQGWSRSRSRDRHRRARAALMSLGADVYVANLDTDTLDAATNTPPRNHPLRNHLNVALRRCSPPGARRCAPDLVAAPSGPSRPATARAGERQRIQAPT